MAVGAPQPSSLAFFVKASDESLILTVLFFAAEVPSFLPVAESLQSVLVPDRTD